MSSDLETIDKLTRDATATAADKLQELERNTAKREISKAARKALYTLSQAEIVPSKRHMIHASEPEKVNKVRAFASAFDGAGNRLILFLVPDPDGGSATLLQILTNDAEGVRDCETLKIRRGELEERVNRIKAQVETGLAVAEIEPDYGRWLLANARSLNSSLSKRSPSALLPWIGRIGDPVDEYAPPIYTRVTEDEIKSDETIPTDPSELFKLQWLEPWFFAAEDTMPWLPQWEQVTSEAGENPDMGPGTPIDKIVVEAANGLVTDDMRKLYIVRLEETADVLWRCGKEAEAKQTVYHAIALKSSSPAADIPFAHEIALRTLGAAFEMVRLYRERRAGG